MGRVIKIELERAFRSKGMTLALLIGYAIVVIHAIKVVYPTSNMILQWYDGSAHTNIHTIYDTSFLMEHNTPYREIFIYLLPILATLPFGITYLTDRKKGYIKNVCTRCKKTHYLLAKYIAVFVSGGVTVALPIILGLIIAASMLPAVEPVLGGNYGLIGGGMLGSLFYTHPLLYYFVYILLYFLHGGAYATIALAVSHIFEYSFFVLIMPFAVYYGLGVISPYTVTKTFGLINPRLFFTIPTMLNVEERTCLILLVIITVVSFIVYWIGGIRRDIL